MKMKVPQQCVITVLFSGVKTWTLTMSKIQITQRQMERAILNITKLFNLSCVIRS